jgi:N-methylhydantoinase B
VIMEVGGGGGFGPPRERRRDMVRSDLAAGYISARAADAEYGNAIESGSA